MSKIVGLSTGSVYLMENSINDQINILREIGVNAIEILIAKGTDLNEKISTKNIEFLKKQKYVSLHAPFYQKEKIPYDFNKQNVERLSHFYNKINAKAIIVHPNLVNDWDILSKTDMNVCIENMSEKRNITVKFFRNIFLKYPHFSMNLDTAHALSYGEKYLNELVEKFKERIYQVHFSDRRLVEDKLKDHQTISSCTNLEKFNMIKKLKCPIIIELTSETNKDKLKSEIEFVKEFLPK